MHSLRNDLIRFQLKTCFVVTFICSLLCLIIKMKLDELQEQKMLHELGISTEGSKTGNLFYAEILYTLSPIDDKIQRLRKHKSLKGIDLSLANIGSAGIKQLSNMEHIQSLKFHDPCTTANVLQELSGMNRLEELTLSNAHVKDCDLQTISSLKALKRLDLTQNEITDEGMIYIAQLSNLKELTICGNGITEHGISLLAQCPVLTCLDISLTDISIEGLLSLQQLSGLRELKVSHWRSSDFDCQILRLSLALPKCKIRYLESPSIFDVESDGTKFVIFENGVRRSHAAIE